MLDCEIFPEITCETNALYVDVVRKLVRRLIPDEVLASSDALSRWIEAHLPLVKASKFEKTPFHLSLYLLTPHRLNATKFFYDMVSRWLLPGRKINIELVFGADFRFAALPERLFIAGEIVIEVKSEEDRRLIEKHLTHLAKEIAFGVSSMFRANRILEMRGLNVYQKSELIQEELTSLHERWPELYDTDLFIQMQKLLVSTSEVYKGMRESFHLKWMITSFYVLQKKLELLHESEGAKRHIRIKFAPVTLETPLGIREAVGIVVALNFLKANEVFEKHHIKKALEPFGEDLIVIEDSYINVETRQDQLKLSYIEVEKIDGSPLSLDEQLRLQKHLPEWIATSIEKRLRPLFMPRNEEEVMRSVVMLSDQLRFVRDIPQVIVKFDEQKDDHLIYTVIILRLLKKKSQDAYDLFKDHPIFTIDRVKKTGKLRKRIDKEAIVLRAKVSWVPFLRQDHALDLYQARDYLLDELQSVLGEVRDYNGGMISKQNEVFMRLQEALGPSELSHSLLLENFFHSIYPVELRSLMSVGPLLRLFTLLKSSLGQTELIISEEEEHTFFLLGVKEGRVADEIMDEVSTLPFGRLEIAQLRFSYYNMVHVGFILLSSDRERVEKVKHIVHERHQEILTIDETI